MRAKMEVCYVQNKLPTETITLIITLSSKIVLISFFLNRSNDWSVYCHY